LASQKPKIPRPSRQWKGPSERDLWVFRRVEIEGQIHQTVARDAGLRRSRVTHIVSRVRRYLAQAAGDDPGIENPLARQRLDLEVEKLRIEFAISAAVNVIKSRHVPLVTKRSGSRDKYGSKEEWNETITRDRRPDIQAINTLPRPQNHPSSCQRSANTGRIPQQRLAQHATIL